MGDYIHRRREKWGRRKKNEPKKEIRISRRSEESVTKATSKRVLPFSRIARAKPGVSSDGWKGKGTTRHPGKKGRTSDDTSVAGGKGHVGNSWRGEDSTLL